MSKNTSFSKGFNQACRVINRGETVELPKIWRNRAEWLKATFGSESDVIASTAECSANGKTGKKRYCH